ncbi:hypothetical protein E0Z10_g7185 [Xylaria hypoxylon]|uniref:Uncharacterized protein n=1 Tax=Xylaria hypoxylon TaxID=37992 RepID=A0A4Z0YQ79_9PEZI|nr:hypothetical protein E0Z10_g7185 [Xylaria hypoxylon]
MSSVLNEEVGVEITVELGMVKGVFVEREPDGASELPVAVVIMVPELNPVSDANDAVLLGTESAVELVRVNGGFVRGDVLVSDVSNTVPFDTGITAVRVVPGMVVGSTVPTVDAVMVVSMVAVNVLAVTVVGEIVNINVEDEISVLFVLLELNAELVRPGGLLIRVEFATGYGAELDGCTDMAEEPPLALVRVVPEETSETGGVPEEVDDVAVTMDVVNSPLGTEVGLIGPDELVAGNRGVLDDGPVELMPVFVAKLEVRKGETVLVSGAGRFDGVVKALLASDDGPPDSVRPLVVAVELGNGYGPVEEPIMVPDVPVDNGGPVPESNPVLETPGDPGVELLPLTVGELEGVVMASVEKLRPLVRLPLGLTELKLSEETGGAIVDTPEPLLLENPVGPIVAPVELVIENDSVLAVGYDPVPDTDSLELLNGKGTVDEVLEIGRPEENAVTLLVVGALDDDIYPRVVEREALGKDSVIVGDSVPGRVVVPLTPCEVELLGGYRAVCEPFCAEVVACPDGGPFVETLAETDPPLGFVGTPAPPAEPPVVPTVGSEEFVMGKGVTSLAVRELAALVFVDNVAENDPEAGTVKELDTLKEVFAALADESDEFVCGKGVVMLVRLVVGVEELVTGYRVVSLALGLGPGDTRVLVSPIEPLVGLMTGVEEFVNGKGAVSLAPREVRVRFAFVVDDAVVIDSKPKVAEELAALNEFVGLTVRAVEFVDDKGLVPSALREPVVVAGTVVGIEVDAPVLLG